MADDKVDILDATVREMIAHANTTWDDTIDVSFDRPDLAIDVEPLVLLQETFIARFREIFKDARQEAYNLGLQDASQLVEWDKIWAKADEWMSNNPVSVVGAWVEFKSEIKRLVLESMKEKSK